jgi:hypothetical protein
MEMALVLAVFLAALILDGFVLERRAQVRPFRHPREQEFENLTGQPETDALLSGCCD